MDSEAARQQLERWGMSDATAGEAGLFDTHDVSTLYPTMKAGPAIIIPYYSATGQLLRMRNGQPFARVRRLTADEVEVPGFVKKKKIRYTQPTGMGPQVYFPQVNDIDWESIQKDPTVPIVLTEGEAKAITACAEGFQTIALGGVFNFSLPNGHVIAGLEQFEWAGRHVYVAFDSDAVTNPNVLTAEARLVQELQGRRNAHCHIVRIPSETDDKVGLDDYLRAHGADALERLIEAAKPLSSVDVRVVAMNERYAWIDMEGMVFDFNNRRLIRKGDFTNGALASSEKIYVPGQKGVKEILVSEKWLKHAHAQRYSELLFRPSEGVVVRGQHAPALNLWNGWGDTSEGDVGPFLRLHNYMFGNQTPELRELALNLVIYKAQNPHVKVPLAIVLIGKQGGGKTIWADCIRDAFHPYGATPNPSSLSGDFEGWLETCVLATVHEMKPEDVQRSSEKIKALISDKTRPMNEKYRVSREVQYYGFHIFTSNFVGVGAYAEDDRRMIVYNVPPHGPEQLYNDIWAWREAGGGQHLMHWMLNYDLKGWKPPQHAPMTAAKAMASMEAMSPIERLAVDMRSSNEHVILRWLDSAAQWAQSGELSQNSVVAGRAREIAQSVKSFQIRPWYTPEELAMMFPMIIEQLMGSKYAVGTPSGMLSSQLRNAGITFLASRDDPRGFWHQGQIKQYLVVAEFDKWADGVSQAHFEQHMKEWPTYGALKGQRRA